jgi:hypothetical protein
VKAAENSKTFAISVFVVCVTFVVFCMLIKLCQLSRKGNRNQSDSEGDEQQNLRRREVYRREENLRRERLLEEDVRRINGESQSRNNESRSFVVDEIIDNLRQQGQQPRPSAPIFNSRTRSHHNRFEERPSAPVLVQQTSSQPSNPRATTNVNDDMPPSYDECFRSS